MTKKEFENRLLLCTEAKDQSIKEFRERNSLFFYSSSTVYTDIVFLVTS